MDLHGTHIRPWVVIAISITCLAVLLMTNIPVKSEAKPVEVKEQVLSSGYTISEAEAMLERGMATKRFDDLNGNNIHDRLEKEVDLNSTERIEVLIRFNFKKDWNTLRYKIPDEAIGYLRSMGVEITHVFYEFGVVHAYMRANLVRSVASLNFVDFIGLQPKFHIFLDTSVPAIKADSGTLASEGMSDITGEGVTIAVLDTGIYGGHAAFTNPNDSNKIVAWHDFINGQSQPYDDHGHGTHCASIAAGNPQSDPYVGVAPKAKLIGLKVMDKDGTGGLEIEQGMQWCYNNQQAYNIKVMSMSLGTVGYGSSTIDGMVSNLVSVGIVVVAAAGNEGPQGSPPKQPMGSPARAQDSITVGSCTNSNTLSTFSTWGVSDSAAYDSSDPSQYWFGYTKPEVLAPGEQIYAANSYYNGDWTDMNGEAAYAPGAGTPWIMSQGTSMACPHVAGAVALMLQANPNMTPTDIKEALKANTLQKAGDGEKNVKRGWGMIQVAPTLQAIGNPPILDSYTVNGQQSVEVKEDESVTFTASAHDSNQDGYIARYDWDLDGDGNVDQSGQSVTWSYPKSGTYTVTVWAVDNQGLSDKGTLSVSVRNLPPTAEAGSDITANMDEVVRLDASGSSDTPSDLQSLNYYWDLDGDGSYDEAQGKVVNHTWTSPGTYTVGLKVVDDDYAESTDTLQVIIKNVAPTAVARLGQGMNPGEIYEDDEVTFDASDSTDTASDAGKLSYAWDFDNSDGVDWDNPDAQGKTPKHTYTHAGTYTVSLKVTDPHGGEDTTTIQVVVQNVEPNADIKGINPSEPKEGELVMADATSTWDTASDLNLLNYTWDTDIDYDSDGNGIGDDDMDAYGQVIYFRPVRDGEITMKVTVVDDDGAESTDYLTFNATNVPPVINDPDITDSDGNPVTEVYEGETIHIKANISDVVTDLNIMEVYWEFEDMDSSGWEVTYTPEHDGPLTFSITASDDHETVSREFSSYIKVLNRPPVVKGGTEDRTVNTGSKVAFNLDVEDSETDLSHMEYTWNFGDGSSDTTTEPSTSHTYTTGGEYVVQVRVSDGTDSVIVKINVSVNTPPNIFVSAPSEAHVGDKITLSAKNTIDPDGDAITKYEWDLNGDGVYEESGESVTINAEKEGKITYKVRITDSRGGISTKSGTITVTEKPSLFSNAGSGGGGMMWAIIIIIIIVVVLAALLLMKRSKDRKQMAREFFDSGKGNATPNQPQQIQQQNYYSTAYGQQQNYYGTGDGGGSYATQNQQPPTQGKGEENPYQYTNYEEIYGGSGEL